MPFFPKPRRRPAPADAGISTTDAAPRPFRPHPATGTQPAGRPRFQRGERHESPFRDDRPRREDRPRDGRRPAGDFPRAGRPAERRDARPGSRSRNEALQDPWVDGQPRFLPMSRAEMQALGWKELDVLLVNGDAYVDHPAFGPVLLGRWLVAHGFRVGIVAQPRWQSPDDLLVMGRPRLFVGVSAGALDSMLAHYTAFRKKRHDDAYTPGGRAGARPNRACLVYANLARQAFPGLPVILGGIEASLRRTTHYDFWTDSLRRSILLDAKADLLIYGMGELAMLECARRLAEGKSLHGIDGTAWLAKVDENNVPVDLPEEWLDLPRMQLPSHEAVQAEATELLRLTQMLEQQVHRQNAWAQQMVGDRALVLAPPARPLTTEEMDQIYALPYARSAHPRYREPIPADEMLRTSITSHRGCGGGCSFCSLALHQGRRISSRSQGSILAEARKLVAQSRRGQVAISDVGGPTANMWQAHCALDDATAAKAEPGARPSSRCRRSSCCYPTVCKSFITPQMQHVSLLREVAALPGVRQVRVASGVRADLALNDPEALAAYTGEFTGGQLKVAPEHCAARVLDLMRKPGMEVFEAFLQSFVEQSRLAGREQYVVPYMMSAFPGCTDEDMHELARWLQQRHWSPQQTQCFIPTPGSIATAMYYCGRNEAGEEIYVARSDADRLRQHRILMPDFGRMPEHGSHAGAEDAGEGHPRGPRRENTTERWRDERRSADGLARRHEGRRDFREDRQPPFSTAAADDDGQPFRKDGFRTRRFHDRDGDKGRDAWRRPRPFARFDDEQDEAPRRDFRHPDRDGFRKPAFRQDADKTSGPVPSPMPPETVTGPRRPGPRSVRMPRKGVPSGPVATVSWTAMGKKASVPSGRAPSPRLLRTTPASLSARTASVLGTSTTATPAKARTNGNAVRPSPASMTSRTKPPAVISADPSATASASTLSGRMPTSPSGPVATVSWTAMGKKASVPFGRAPSPRLLRTTPASLSARTASVPGTSTTATPAKARTNGNAVRPSPASMASRMRPPAATSAAPNATAFASPPSGRMPTSPSGPVPSLMPHGMMVRPRRPGPRSARMPRKGVPSGPVATVSWTAMGKKASVLSGRAPSLRLLRTTTASLSARRVSVPGASMTATATKGRTNGSVPAPLPASMTGRTRPPAATSADPSATAFASPASGRMRTSPSARTPSAGTASPPSAPAVGTRSLTARR